MLPLLPLLPCDMPLLASTAKSALASAPVDVSGASGASNVANGKVKARAEAAGKKRCAGTVHGIIGALATLAAVLLCISPALVFALEPVLFLDGSDAWAFLQVLLMAIMVSLNVGCRVVLGKWQKRTEK